MTRIKTTLLVVAGLLVFAVAFTAPAISQQNNVISIGNVQAAPDANITTPISITNAASIAGIKINLSYNPAIVNVTDYTPGDFDDMDLSDISTAQDGYVVIWVMEWSGLSGNKTVADVKLTAVGGAGDTTDLNISIIALKDDAGLEVTDRSTENGTFTILGGPTPTIVFDTGSPANPYPSISGIHNGTITPNQTVTVQKLYTYPCAGTGGHSEYVRIYHNESAAETIAEGNWTGYGSSGCDWHNISFDTPFILKANESYNYTIKTGSYPQIIHEHTANVTGGEITCTKFTDANGRVYYDWIPAIKFFW